MRLEEKDGKINSIWEGEGLSLWYDISYDSCFTKVKNEYYFLIIV